MTLTMFLIAGVAVGLTAMFVMTGRSAVHAALAGQNTAVGLGDPAAETAVGGGVKAQTRTEWQMTAVTSLSDAEELLDCLENQGIAERELVVLGESAFAVRWR